MIGEYEKVSSPYSKEVSSFINTLMTHNQKKRPDAKELLCHPKMLEMKHEFEDQENDDERLLKTIKFPKNLNCLNEQLPKPKYDLNKSKSTKIIQLPPE